MKSSLRILRNSVLCCLFVAVANCAPTKTATAVRSTDERPDAAGQVPGSKSVKTPEQIKAELAKIDADASRILLYWFGEPETWSSPVFTWNKWTKTADSVLIREFTSVWQRMDKGELNGWKDNTYSAMAFIILADQMARNIFRDENQQNAYKHDDAALEFAEVVYERDFASLPPVFKYYLSFPFMHSEANPEADPKLTTDYVLKNHQLAVLKILMGLMEEYPQEPTFMKTFGRAVDHYRVIRFFGRFVHRNEKLGRTSTPAEKCYIEAEEMFETPKCDVDNSSRW
jgi:uncharacterized protein (DUF924 family)